MQNPVAALARAGQLAIHDIRAAAEDGVRLLAEQHRKPLVTMERRQEAAGAAHP